jgi:hypothetical protein
MMSPSNAAKESRTACRSEKAVSNSRVHNRPDEPLRDRLVRGDAPGRSAVRPDSESSLKDILA